MFEAALRVFQNGKHYDLKKNTLNIYWCLRLLVKYIRESNFWDIASKGLRMMKGQSNHFIFPQIETDELEFEW